MSATPIEKMKKVYQDIFISDNYFGSFAVKPLVAPYAFFNNKSKENSEQKNRTATQEQEYANVSLTEDQERKAKIWGVIAVILCSPVLIPVTNITCALALAGALVMAVVSPLLFGGAAIVQGVQYAVESCKKQGYAEI